MLNQLGFFLLLSPISVLFRHTSRDVGRNKDKWKKSCDSVSPTSLSGISAHLWTDNCAVALTVLLLWWHAPNLITCSIHTYYLAACISTPSRLLSHYLHFTQREPAVTQQSKQALMWIWCYAYGTATLFLCCCSEGTGLACTQAPAMICGGIWHLSVCKWSSGLTFRGGAWSTLVGEAISIDGINIQQRRAGTQNNTVSKTATRRWKQKKNKSILMEVAQ